MSNFLVQDKNKWVLEEKELMQQWEGLILDIICYWESQVAVNDWTVKSKAD